MVPDFASDGGRRSRSDSISLKRQLQSKWFNEKQTHFRMEPSDSTFGLVPDWRVGLACCHLESQLSLWISCRKDIHRRTEDAKVRVGLNCFVVRLPSANSVLLAARADIATLLL